MAGKRGPNAAVLLAEGLVARLTAEKIQPSAPFPWTLRQLVASVAPVTSPAEVEKVVAKAIKAPAFADRAFLVKPPSGKTYPIAKAMDSPVALWEDAQDLAASRAALEFLVHENPSSNVAQITKWVCAKPRADFQLAIASPLAAFLYDSLAARLVATLREQRQQGETSYPLTVERLADLAKADRTLILDAMGRPAFAEAAFVLAPPRSGPTLTPTQRSALLGRFVTLNEDHNHLFTSRVFLEGAIRDRRAEKAKSGNETVAFTLNDLATKQFKGFGEKQQAYSTRFINAVMEKMSSGALPATIAWIKQGAMPHFFLIEDLGPPALRERLTAAGGAVPTAAAPPRGSTGTFPSRFDSAFGRLDRDRGSNNFVWLFELREALPEFTREQFNAGLHHLREARRYKLNAGEGHYGMTQQQREASIREAGTVYLSVSRIDR